MKQAIVRCVSGALLLAVFLAAATGRSAEKKPGPSTVESAAAEAVKALCWGHGQWSVKEQIFWRRHAVLDLACFMWPHSFPSVAATPDGRFVVLSSETYWDPPGDEDPAGEQPAPGPDAATRTAQQRSWDRVESQHHRALDGARRRFNQIAEREKLSLSEAEVPVYLGFFLGVFLHSGDDYLPDEATAQRVAATEAGSKEGEAYRPLASRQPTVTARRAGEDFEGEAYAWAGYGPVIRHRISVTARGAITGYSREWMGGQKSQKQETSPSPQGECWSSSHYSGLSAKESAVNSEIQQCGTYAVARLVRSIGTQPGDVRTEVVRELRIEPLQLGEEVWPGCERAGTPDPDLIGVGIVDDGRRPRIAAPRLVFRLDRSRAKIEAEDPTGVVCTGG